jgi:hypothetical protein
MIVPPCSLRRLRILRRYCQPSGDTLDPSGIEMHSIGYKDGQSFYLGSILSDRRYFSLRADRTKRFPVIV